MRQKFSYAISGCNFDILSMFLLLCTAQVKIAQRIGLIQHLPTGTFDGCKKNRE